jgi:hypothetical protein
MGVLSSYESAAERKRKANTTSAKSLVSCTAEIGPAGVHNIEIKIDYAQLENGMSSSNVY